MFEGLLIAFAIAVLAQRALEIGTHDRTAAARRPHWTAVAMTALHVTIVLAAVGERWLRGTPPPWLATTAGLLLLAAGIALRRAVIHALAGQWSIDVDIKPGHRLITEGPFSWCRHPNYLAILIEVVGICLVPAAWWVLAAGFPLYLIVLVGRIRHEERVLLQVFGGEYERYMQSHGRLLPKWPRRRS